MNWLRMTKEHIATSFHIEVDDLDLTPFGAQGGSSMMFAVFGTGMFAVFGTGMNAVISEMNGALAV